ncbi:MAG: aliphatic sulfonate ABC transporter substrate-binding protein [Cyanobacteria bacterium P01_A01_bin.83]
MSKKIWLVALILIGSFFLVNVQSQFQSTREVSKFDVPLVIGYSNSAGWWPWAIAEKQGLFAHRNLDVELRWYDDYSQSLADLRAGYIDANCQTLSDTIINAEQAVKGEVAIVITDSSIGNDKIMADIGIKTLEDLKDKTIAVEGGANDFLLALSLDRAKLSNEDVNVISVETGAALEAFIANQSEAVRVFPPYSFNALEKKGGAHEVISSAEFSDLMLNLLVVNQDLIDRHPKKVQALTDTWFDLLNFMLSNLDLSNEIQAQRAGVEPQIINLLRSGTKMYRLEDNLDAFNQGKNVLTLSSALKETADFLKNNLGLIERKPDPAKLINPQFVKMVKR